MEYTTSFESKFSTASCSKTEYKIPAGANISAYITSIDQSTMSNETYYSIQMNPDDYIGSYFLEEMTIVMQIDVNVPDNYESGTFNLRTHLNGNGGLRVDPINRATSLMEININGERFVYQQTNIGNALYAMNYGAKNIEIDGVAPLQLDCVSNYGYLNSYKLGSTQGYPIDNGGALQDTIEQMINNPFATMQNRTYGNMPRQLSNADMVFVTDFTGNILAEDQNPELQYDSGIANVYYIKWTLQSPFYMPLTSYYQKDEKLWHNIEQINFHRMFSTNMTNLLANFNELPNQDLNFDANDSEAIPIVIRALKSQIIGQPKLYATTYTLPDFMKRQKDTVITWNRFIMMDKKPITFQGTVDPLTPLIGQTPTVLVTPSPLTTIQTSKIVLGTLPKNIWLWCQRVDDTEKSTNDSDAMGIYFDNLSISINSKDGLLSQLSGRQLYDLFSAKKGFSKSFLETRYVTVPFNTGGTNVAGGAWAIGDNAYCNLPLFGQVLCIDLTQIPNFDWSNESIGCVKPITIQIIAQVGSCDNSFIGITDNGGYDMNDNSLAYMYTYIEEESYLIIDEQRKVRQYSPPITKEIIQQARNGQPTELHYINPLLQGDGIHFTKERSKMRGGRLIGESELRARKY